MKNYITILLLVFLFSCSATRGFSKNEYEKTVIGLSEKRPYPVLRKPSHIPILTEALKEDSAVIRYNAAHDLKALGQKARGSLVPLIECYKDVDFKVARVCFVASTKALGDPYIEPRAKGWFSSGEKDPIENLEKYLNSGTTQQKVWSLKLLSKMGKSTKRIVNPVISSLGDSSADVRSAASDALIQTDANISQELVDNLDKHKASISYILGKRGEKQTVEHIQPLINDSDSNVRIAAAQALLLLGVNSQQQARVLGSSLGSVSEMQRKQMISTLNSSGHSSEVSGYLNAERQKKNLNIKRTKKQIDSRAKTASRKVRNKLLRDRDETRRQNASNPNNRIRSKKQIPLLNSSVVNADATQAVEALSKLAELAPHYPDAYEPIVSSLNNQDPSVRAHSAALLGDLRKPRSVNSLILTLEDENINVRDSAIVALLSIATPEALAAVNKFPEKTKTQALRKISNTERSKLLPLVRCAEAKSLCKLYLQQTGSNMETINEESSLCAYYVQPGC